MAFYEQLVKLCDKNGVKPTTLVESLGMSKGTMSNWKKGGNPSGDAVVRFAKHFGVSTDYLLLGKETAFKEISEEDLEILELFHKLPGHKREYFKGKIEGYLEGCENSVAAEPTQYEYVSKKSYPSSGTEGGTKVG